MSVVGGGGSSLGAVGIGIGEVGVGVGVSCEGVGFNGEEPGLGGSEGWSAGPPLTVASRGTGNVDEGVSAGAAGSDTLTGGTFVSFSGAGEAFAASF